VVAAYNVIISEAVDGINEMHPGTCGLVDANELMAELPEAQKTHFLFAMQDPANEGDYQLAAASTYFSLDGIHPNQKGYGMIANAFLAEINVLRGTSYSDVNLDDLIWDPLYGQDISDKSQADGLYRISPKAARALEYMNH